MLSKTTLVVILVLSLPILLVVYNPAAELGSIGMILGAIGYFVSPVVIFGTLVYFLFKGKSSK